MHRLPLETERSGLRLFALLAHAALDFPNVDATAFPQNEPYCGPSDGENGGDTVAIGEPDDCGRGRRSFHARAPCFRVVDVIAAAVTAILAAQGGQTVITPPIADFDLEKIHHEEATCANRGDTDAIIVCAPKNMNIWIADTKVSAPKPLREGFTGPLNAETTLHVIQSPNPTVATPAVGVTLKWHF